LIFKTLTFILYDLINHPNIMGARHSCGKYFYKEAACRYLYQANQCWQHLHSSTYVMWMVKQLIFLCFRGSVRKRA
jgi:hypothetical protein